MKQPVSAAAPGRLGLGTKIGYGVGDIFGGGAFIIISTYYVRFLTDVMQINIGLAGIAFMLSKIWDGVTDPFEGVLTDRTRTRMGRRRPFLLAGIPFIFLSFFLMWYPAAFSSEATRFAYALATYLFFSTVISLVMIPYSALAAELTLDYHQRASLSGWRILFSNASSLACAVAPPVVVGLFADVRTGYTVMAVVFGLFFALPFIAVVAATRERPEFQQPPQAFNLDRTYVAPFRSRTFRSVLFMYLPAFIAMDAVMAIVSYFVDYQLGRTGTTNLMMGAMILAQMASIPVYLALSRKIGKRPAFMLGCLVWCAALSTSFGLGPATPVMWLYAFAVFVGVGTGGVVLMIYAIFPDVPDVDELVSAGRQEGSFTALFQVSRKLSSALGIFLVTQILNVAGYRKPVMQVIDGAEKAILQAQTAQFITTIRIVFVFVPIAMLVLSMLAAARFPLTPALHARLKALLERRRAGSTAAGDDAEGLELARRLVGPRAVPAVAPRKPRS